MDVFIRSWVINIVAIGFLGVIIDLLLSESDFRKFTRFVVGIIMLLAIIRPVLHILNNPPLFDGTIFYNTQAIRVEALREDADEKRTLAQERIMRLFTGNLQDQIEEQVKMLKGYESVEARIEFAEDEQNNPDINAISGIWLTIIDRRISGIENINVDIISFKKAEKSHYTQYTQKEEAFAIRDHLFAVYNVDKDNIYLIFEDQDSAVP